MLIRDIRKHELGKLLDLYGHLHERDDPRPPRAEVESVWEEALGNPRIRYFGGYVGSELVSSCTLAEIPNLTRGCRPYAIIENVVTHALHRKRGWGKAVLRHALEHAWSRNCYKVMLLTGRMDEGTLRFYESAGFDRFGKQAFLAKPPFPPPTVGTPG